MSAACVLVLSLSFLPVAGVAGSGRGVAGSGVAALLPLPGQVARLPKDAAGIGELVAARPRGALPDLADYLAHRAYQESIALGRYGRQAYGAPVPVTAPRFDLADGRPRMRVETLLDFSEAWIADAVRDARSSGVLGFGIGAERFSRIGRGTDAKGRISMPAAIGNAAIGNARLEPADFLVYIIVLAPLAVSVLGRGALFGRIATGASPVTAAQRRRNASRRRESAGAQDLNEVA